MATTKKYVSLSKLEVFLDNLKNTFATKVDIDGKADSSHAHNDLYYTETETNNLLAEKADISHTHDDRYYTETEVDDLISNKASIQIVTWEADD